jgi:hypothetical protein
MERLSGRRCGGAHAELLGPVAFDPTHKPDRAITVVRGAAQLTTGFALSSTCNPNDGLDPGRGDRDPLDGVAQTPSDKRLDAEAGVRREQRLVVRTDPTCEGRSVVTGRSSTCRHHRRQ